MKIIECETLDQVRSNIDLIDEKIIKLLAERSFYVSQAAKFKKTQSEVEAPNRVEEVIIRIRDLSKQYDLNPDVGEKIFRTIISTFVDQEKLILETNNTSKND